MKKHFFSTFHFSLPIILCLLFIVMGLALRLYRLDSAPPRLTVDEMSIGYNAYSILNTGKDEWGKSWPLAFQAFGDYKQPIYIYLTLPAVALLGLTPIAIRLPSVLAGTVLIWLSYLLVKRNWGVKPALWTAFLVAVSPWSIHLSRMGFESNVAVALFLTGLVAMQNMSESKSRFWSVIAGICFALTFYTYISFRLIVVAMFVVFGILSIKKKVWRKQWLTMTIITGFFVLPIASQLFQGSGTARFLQVSLFSNQGFAAQELERRNFCFLLEPHWLPHICRVFFQKDIFLVSTFVRNYLGFFSPEFLFWRGDEVTYLNPAGFGEFWLILFPAFVIGLIYFWRSKNPLHPFWKMLVLILPIPSALVASPQIVRGSAMMIFLTIILGLGIEQIVEITKNKRLRKMMLIVMSGVFILSISYQQLYYHAVYVQQSEVAFSPFSSQLSQYVIDHESEYEQIYFQDQYFSDAHIFIAYSQHIDPALYQQIIIRPTADQYGFSHPVQLGKYYFGNKKIDDLVCDESITSMLFVTDDQEFPIKETNEVLYDFSHVHPQVKFISVADYRQRLQGRPVWESMCINEKNK